MKRISVVVFLLLIGACSGEPAKSGLPAPAPGPAPAGDVEAGRKLIDQYACVACHVIPGAEGGGSMGPSLDKIATRPTISGRVPNDPKTMAAYLQNPSAVDPPTRMPAVGLSEEEAQHITAYLFTLK